MQFVLPTTFQLSHTKADERIPLRTPLDVYIAKESLCHIQNHLPLITQWDRGGDGIVEQQFLQKVKLIRELAALSYNRLGMNGEKLISDSDACSGGVYVSPFRVYPLQDNTCLEFRHKSRRYLLRIFDGKSEVSLFRLRPRLRVSTLQKKAVLYCPWTRLEEFVHPDLSFSNKMTFLAAKSTVLASMSAYMSTLGGGFFLCNHVDEALEIAKKQVYIAYLMDDVSLWKRSHVHFVHIFIKMKKWKAARRALRVLRACESEWNDEVFSATLEAADCAYKEARGIETYWILELDISYLCCRCIRFG